MGSEIEIVRKYYDDNVQKEWERIDRHKAEFEITKRFMRRYIKRVTALPISAADQDATALGRTRL